MSGCSAGWIGRLRAGLSLAEAQRDVTSVAAALEQEHQDSNRGRLMVIVPIADQAGVDRD